MLQLSNPKSAANGWAKALKKIQTGNGMPVLGGEDKNDATKGGAKAEAKKSNGKAKATNATEGPVESNDNELSSSQEAGELLLNVASSDRDDPAEFFDKSPFEDGPGGFPGKMTVIRRPNGPLEVVVGPPSPKKRAPRAPPKPKVGAASAAPSKKRPREWIATNYDEDGNIIRPKRTRVPSKKAAAAAAAAAAVTKPEKEELEDLNQEMLNILWQEPTLMGVTDEELLGEDKEEAPFLPESATAPGPIGSSSSLGEEI